MKNRDVDSAERMFTIKIGFWSLAGLVIGGAVGGKIGGPLGTLIGAPLGFGLVFMFARALMNAAGSTVATIFTPSGNSTPPKREYSQPQALEARGRYQEAIQAYEVFCVQYPEDPEPYLRIARLYRNELQQFEDAISWFKKARSNGRMSSALELLITQEIVEVYTHRLGTPQRAIPELARLSDRFPGTEAGTWARTRLAELRKDLPRAPEDS